VNTPEQKKDRQTGDDRDPNDISDRHMIVPPGKMAKLGSGLV
jgi:hypothetical protein